MKTEIVILKRFLNYTLLYANDKFYHVNLVLSLVKLLPSVIIVLPENCCEFQMLANNVTIVYN